MYLRRSQILFVDAQERRGQRQLNNKESLPFKEYPPKEYYLFSISSFAFRLEYFDIGHGSLWRSHRFNNHIALIHRRTEETIAISLVGAIIKYSILARQSKDE